MSGRGMLRRAVPATVVAALVSVLVGVAGASGFTEPGMTYGLADFANCPISTVGPLTQNSGCVHSYVTGGAVQIGSAIVPISVPGDTFDLGFAVTNEEAFEGLVFAPGHGVLNGPAQPVPGGLLGSVGNVQLTGVTAKLEWATPTLADTAFGVYAEFCGPTHAVFSVCNTLSEEGPGVTLSVKIHLLSPFLGANCYIGSASSPIVIPLTTGVTNPPPPNTSMHGTSGGKVILDFAHIITFQRAMLVENAFSVPVATGCGTSGGGLVDAAIDHKLGLPSLAGHNTMTLRIEGEQVSSPSMRGSGVLGD